MTLNRFLEAIASKLTELWPDRLVYTDQIPKDADGNHFVGIVESDQSVHLDRRRQRTIQFEVLYFMKKNDTADFNDWAEAMYDNFEKLHVVELTQEEIEALREVAEQNFEEGFVDLDGNRTRGVYLTNVRARRDSEERVFQFLFDAAFNFVLAPEPIPHMENLEQKEDLK